MAHEDIQSLLAVYALDAVDPDEADVIEAHLRECPRCRAEVSEHRETASMLASGHAPAPLRIWDNVLDSLEDKPQPRRVGVLPLRKPRWQRRLVIAAASAAAVLVGVLAVRVVDQDRRIDDMQRALQDRSVLSAALAAQGHPDARRAELRAADGVVLAHAVMVPDGTGYIWADGLPGVSSSRTYQLWAIVGGERISAGILGSTPGLAPFRVAGDVAALAITEEAAGGVAASDNDPVALGSLTRS